ncbi:hypothetical protein RRG08_059439 [Elysia crispata]|uniref:Uncharacterized protein n=1 Tax=Elysia crispata TaxID=231223 RepID=A0AAE1DSL8_9GAST|nr:hypothetical protein RRG08_059439 [Elysia crispata]
MYFSVTALDLDLWFRYHVSASSLQPSPSAVSLCSALASQGDGDAAMCGVGVTDIHAAMTVSESKEDVRSVRTLAPKSHVFVVREKIRGKTSGVKLVDPRGTEEETSGKTPVDPYERHQAPPGPNKPHQATQVKQFAWIIIALIGHFRKQFAALCDLVSPISASPGLEHDQYRTGLISFQLPTRHAPVLPQASSMTNTEQD